MTFSYKDTSQLDEQTLLSSAELLQEYRVQLTEVAGSSTYAVPESCLCLPRDTGYARKIESFAQNFINPALRYVFVIGIGGSNLGTKAIYDALYGNVDVIASQRYPKIIFLDTVEVNFLINAKKLLTSLLDKPESFVINLISKSGGTIESLFNFHALMQDIPLDQISDRVVVTTDEGSPLWKAAEAHLFHRLSIPEPVGGRYSVFSAVGQFPFYLLKIDVDTLLNGAQAALTSCLDIDWQQNPAFLSASFLFAHYAQGKVIHDTFLFHPQLESLGKWYRQLMAESLGKQKELEGTMQHIGMLPTVSIGTTDLHSVAQLYLAGPRDKVTTFVTAGCAADIALGSEPSILNTYSDLHRVSASTLLDSIYKSVSEEYRTEGLPFVEIRFDAITEYELGQFMQFKMVEVMYLAKLLNVPAFDQPNVEGYKERTKQLLAAA